MYGIRWGKCLVTASTACVCLWYSKCAYMCDIHHHLQSCVWKAGLVVVGLCAMCLLLHIEASPALTRLQFQDAERLWMSIHKFTGDFWYSKAKNFSLSFHLRLSLSQLHLSSFSACLSKPIIFLQNIFIEQSQSYNRDTETLLSVTIDIISKS